MATLMKMQEDKSFRCVWLCGIHLSRRGSLRSDRLSSSLIRV